MEDTLPAKPICLSKDEENQKILETKSFEIKIENEEFELFLNVYDSSYIEFKVMQKDTIPTCYFIEKYNLENINKASYTFCKELKEVFQFYCKILQKNKVRLLFSKEKNQIYLNFKNIINFDEEVEANIELKEVKLSKDEIFQELIKEVIELKKGKNNKNELISKETINELKKEMNSEIALLKKSYEEKIQKLENKIMENEKNYEKNINDLKNNYEEKNKNIENANIKIIENEKKIENKINEIKNDYKTKIKEIDDNLKNLMEDYNNRKEQERIEENKKKEEEKIYTLNDNVDLINNFKFENVNNLRNINTISNDLNITHMKSVAVFNLIKNKEILYEVAYPDNNNGYNIIIYNLSLNKLESKINKAHSNSIHKIKHYYYNNIKAHTLLSTSKDASIKLWNISSNPITNILKIDNCFDGDNYSPFCIMFNQEDLFVLGGSRNERKKIWNQNGTLIGYIEKSKLDYGRFIEAAYLDNKTFILLSGSNHSECFNYEENSIKEYKCNGSEVLAINLFKKDKTIYLISGDTNGNLCIFDFNTTNLIKEIKINGGGINSLCSINEKILIVSQSTILKIIDMNNYSVNNEYSGHNNKIFGIEKIKISEKGEYIISYDSTSIKIWK